MGAGAAAGAETGAGAGLLPPSSLPPAEIALPGRSMTQLTVLPVTLAAPPAMEEKDENTLPAKLRRGGSTAASTGVVLTVTGGSGVAAPGTATGAPGAAGTAAVTVPTGGAMEAGAAEAGAAAL